MGLAPQPRLVELEGQRVSVLDASWRGVGHTLLDTSTDGSVTVSFATERALEELYEQELECFRPTLIYTFGGTPTHMMMRFRGRRRGVPVVVALHQPRNR